MLRKILCITFLCSLIGMAPVYAAKDKLGALVANELSYGHSGGKIDTKESFIDDLMTGVSDFLTITISDQTVKVVGDTALIRHALAGDTHDKGKDPGKVNLKILQVWKKQGGQWKLLARQAVRIAQ